MDGNVTIYGSVGCPKTDRAQRQLHLLSIGFSFVNIDADPMGREEVVEWNRGAVRLPMVVIEGRGTRILSEPDERELWQALLETKVVDASCHYPLTNHGQTSLQ